MMTLLERQLAVVAATLAVGCAAPDPVDPWDDDDATAVDDTEDAAAVATVWKQFTTTATTLTLTSTEPLLVNSPFFGIEVRKNGEDITEDIEHVETLSPTSWRYTFGAEVMNTPGDTIEISLQNANVAVPGHYVAVRNNAADDVPKTYTMLSQCQEGTGPCAGAPIPGLLAAVKGMSKRYMPRDLQSGPGVYDFSPVFEDAAFLAARGMKLHVMFVVKSFGIDSFHDGDGARKAFPVPAKWEKQRKRELHVYVAGVDTPFTFDATKANVVLATAPPSGNDNVNVVYARDPFPEYLWAATPPVGGWYVGAGGPHTDGNGSHGIAHAPWRTTCTDWMHDFTRAFRQHWDAAIAADPSLAGAIESISVQETANALGGPGYSEAAYRAGLLEYAKANARAVRRRAMFGQLFNQIPGGNQNDALALLATAIVPWGARLEGSDLFNDEPSLEDKVYQLIHRDQHQKALTMIWHQNASYREPDGQGGHYTPAEQFEKARRGIADTQTPSGTPGLEAEYVFWNLTINSGSAYDYRDALRVIAANPVIQTRGNQRHRWRRASNYAAIREQSLSRINP
jgi:hypothetical protein